MDICSYLLQCVAAHPETRVPFMKGKILMELRNSSDFIGSFVYRLGILYQSLSSRQWLVGV